MKFKIYTKGIFLLDLFFKNLKNRILFGILCCLLAINPIEAYSQPQSTITFQLKGVTLDVVLKEIEKQSGYSFFYNQNDLNLKVKSDYTVVNKNVESALKIVLKNQSIDYTITDKHIVLKKSQAPKPAPQEHTKSVIKDTRVSGIVTDAKGEALIGATIMVKNTTTGVLTDVSGMFSINALPENILVVSYMSYLTKEVPVVSLSTFHNIQLDEDTKKLEEIVVVGYGSQRKISTIGAQSGIKNVAELKQPVSNMASVLAGRVSGVITRQNNGEAGKDDNTDIWIRGVSTTTSSKPLVLIDGVERSFNSVNPEDIESFQILKDASATAVYGVKGANGVILITTKKGIKGKPRINADFSTGITNFTKVPELADGVTYMQMANEASLTRGGTPLYNENSIRNTAYGNDPYLYPNTNWMNEIFSDFGNNKKLNLNVNGGSDFSQYYVSLGYYNEKGLYKTVADEQYDGKMNYDRFNFVSNLTMQVTKTTEVDLGIIGDVSTYVTPYKSAADVFQMIMKAYPTLYPVTYPNGELPYTKNGGEVLNPYGMIHRMGYNERNTSEVRSSLILRQNLSFILPGLTFKGLFAYDTYIRSDLERKNLTPITYFAIGRDADNNLLINKTDELNGKTSLDFSKNLWGHRQYYIEGSFSYNQTFGTDHKVSGLFLYNQTDYSNITANNLNESLPYRNLGIAGRGTYSYGDRYFTEFNFGYNGSENFAPGNRFGFFPSFGLAWVASNESFFEAIQESVQYLKIRGSWGTAGNSNLNSKRRFAYMDIVGSGNGGYTFGSNRDNSFAGKDFSDFGVNVTWETSTKKNIGIDFNTWKNDLSIQLDVFHELRENIFIQRAAVPSYIGLYSQMLGNFGVVENQGFEATADLTKKIGDLTLIFKGNFSYSKNKVIEDDTPDKPYSHLETRGRSLNSTVGYICDGFYTQDEIDNPEVAKPGGVYQAGDLKYRDLNLDGFIDGNDKTEIGYPTIPRIVYGFGTTLSYKNFSFGAFFQGVGQIDILVSSSSFIPFRDASSKGNLFANITDRWTEENPSQEVFWPRLAYGANINENYATSTHWQKSGSYLRLKTLDFGYTFPSELTKNFGVDNLKLYFLGYNLLTFTGFDMWDVELGGGSGTAYPNVRTYSVGLSLSF